MPAGRHRNVRVLYGLLVARRPPAHHVWRAAGADSSNWFWRRPERRRSVFAILARLLPGWLLFWALQLSGGSSQQIVQLLVFFLEPVILQD